MSAVVEIKNLNVKIGDLTIIDDLSASIPSGKITGLLGPSGAGKTTLFKSILGLRKITSGNIQVFDMPSNSKELHERVGYMTQSPAVYFDLTLQENLSYFARVNGGTKEQVDTLVDMVELDHRRDTVIKNLSGGEKTRVSLVTAILGSPDLLLLDEPTVGLDPVLRDKLWKLFAAFTKRGHTIILTSHVMDEANRCDRILFMREGKLIADGKKDAVLRQSKAKTMEEAFLNLSEDES